MITGIHLQLVAIMIGLLTAYLVHKNGMRQVDKLEVGHTQIKADLEEIEKKVTK